jgi:hypothetical protein
MARVEVHGGTVADGRITSLEVGLQGLPARTLDRDTAVAWMRDGHSLIPRIGGADAAALQLVEVVDGDEVSHFIRTDNQAQAEDSLPFG